MSQYNFETQKGCIHALVGARSSAQVTENMIGGTVSLEAEDLQKMNSVIGTAGKDILPPGIF